LLIPTYDIRYIRFQKAVNKKSTEKLQLRLNDSNLTRDDGLYNKSDGCRHQLIYDMAAKRHKKHKNKISGLVISMGYNE